MSYGASSTISPWLRLYFASINLETTAAYTEFGLRVAQDVPDPVRALVML